MERVNIIKLIVKPLSDLHQESIGHCRYSIFPKLFTFDLKSDIIKTKQKEEINTQEKYARSKFECGFLLADNRKPSKKYKRLHRQFPVK